MANERPHTQKKIPAEADSIKFQIPAAYFDQWTDPVDGFRLCSFKKEKKKPADWVRHQWKPIRIDKSGRLLLGFAFGLCRSISRHFTPTRTDSRTLTPVLCLAACLKREFSSCAPGFPSHSAGAHSSAPLFFFFFLEKKKTKKLSPILSFSQEKRKPLSTSDDTQP